MEKDKITHPFINWKDATPRGYYGRVNLEVVPFLLDCKLTAREMAIFLYVYILMQRAKEPQPVAVNASELSRHFNWHRNSVGQILMRLVKFGLLKRIGVPKKGAKGVFVVNMDNLFPALDEIRNHQCCTF